MTRSQALTVAGTPHLTDLVADADRLAAAVAGGVERWDGPDPAPEAALASLRLDGSPIEAIPQLPANAVPPTPVDAAAAAVAPNGAGRRGTWFDAMRVGDESLADEQIQALEYAGVVTALAADDLADRLLTDPLPALVDLHRLLVRGLMTPERAGTWRITDQAVHDASVGRVIYHPVEPGAIPAALDRLAGWLTSEGRGAHGLVVSGVAHLELLRIHPFEAANGRLARCTAHLLLRATGLDPGGHAAPEPALAVDPLGYHEEVARTLRRRDLSLWLEWWGEAVTDGLRTAARGLGRLPAAVPERAAAFVAGRTGGFTVADYTEEAGVDREAARADLGALLDAGAVARVPGSRGLRFTVLEGTSR